MITPTDAFPRYTAFGPAAPVWCVTPGEGRAIHRFFNTTPFSPSGRYLVAFRLPFEDRLPEPGDRGRVVVVDLQTAEERVVAETAGWEPQLGAQTQWGGDDETVLFNDVDAQTWTPRAVRLNWRTGEKRVFDAPDLPPGQGAAVYHASPCGRYLASACPRRMCRTQRGYGVVMPDERIPRNLGAPDDDGLYITDTQTGETRLAASLRRILDEAEPQVPMPQPVDELEVYGFHAAWNARGDRLMFTLRWYPQSAPYRFDLNPHKEYIRYTVFTLELDERKRATRVYNAVPWTHWLNGGHHATWGPDGDHLTMNLALHSNAMGLRLCRVRYDGRGLSDLCADARGSGHPTLHPRGPFVLTDAYVPEPMSFGDGTIPLRWVDLRTGGERCLVRIRSETPEQSAHIGLRLDPHPAWDRTHRLVAFNGFADGTRRVYVADLCEVVL